MFDTGREYTRDEIHKQLGGSKQSYLPTKNGVVVAACLKLDFNPCAPRVVLCGRGKIIEQAGYLLASQIHTIPIFIKRGVNRWEYCGLFNVVTSYKSGPQFNSYIDGSGRSTNEVTSVVVMAPVPAES